MLYSSAFETNRPLPSAGIENGMQSFTHLSLNFDSTSNLLNVAKCIIPISSCVKQRSSSQRLLGEEIGKYMQSS